jgi:hypothetical protein
VHSLPRALPQLSTAKSGPRTRITGAGAVCCNGCSTCGDHLLMTDQFESHSSIRWKTMERLNSAAAEGAEAYREQVAEETLRQVMSLRTMVLVWTVIGMVWIVATMVLGIIITVNVVDAAHQASCMPSIYREC